jgi:hypothetical protein
VNGSAHNSLHSHSARSHGSSGKLRGGHSAVNAQPADSLRSSAHSNSLHSSSAAAHQHHHHHHHHHHQNHHNTHLPGHVQETAPDSPQAQQYSAKHTPPPSHHTPTSSPPGSSHNCSFPLPHHLPNNVTSIPTPVALTVLPEDVAEFTSIEEVAASSEVKVEGAREPGGDGACACCVCEGRVREVVVEVAHCYLNTVDLVEEDLRRVQCRYVFYYR